MTKVYQARSADYGLTSDNRAEENFEDILSPGSLHATLDGAKASCESDIRDLENEPGCGLDDDDEPAELTWGQTSVDQWRCFVEEYDLSFLITASEVGE